MGPGQMPTGPGMMGQMMPQMMMPPLAQMIQACAQMMGMAQMGGAGGMAPQPKPEPKGR